MRRYELRFVALFYLAAILIALPVFASDAISSTAYATDEILLVMLTAPALIGASAWGRVAATTPS